ncbi:flavin reductase family protein [Ahrensia sp. R2A130]|uniref:flavin reductase family protein n=1 Tax=Ahrensia sp. R2A130 TaxID=744979 RepID=UPI0018DB1B2B|nr:flavin reductase family protein [Ahrensia sp. R2A130]
MSNFTDREFRDALSTFGTGVTIVTARDGDGAPVGMTASSFSSVSMNPPLVLWSAAKKALSGEAFRDAQHFAVHVLHTEQSDLSNRFAKTGTDKFSGLDWNGDANSVPELPDVLARFECSQYAVYEGGDHWIIVGEVTSFEHMSGKGLLHVAGGYASARTLRPSSSEAAE